AGAKLADIVQTDARDLARFEANSFDAVLLLGPLYHLLDLNDRLKAVAEAVRVVRPGGTVVAAIITRYSAIRWGAKDLPRRVLHDRELFETQIETGCTPDAPGFTDLYLGRPQELELWFEGLPVERLAMDGCEGVVSMIRDKLLELDGEPWEYWMDL